MERFEITKDLVGDYHVHPDIEQFVEIGAPVEIEVVLASEVERLREALERIAQITSLHLWWEEPPARGEAVVAIRLEGPDDKLDREVHVDQTFGNIARMALNASDGGANVPAT